MAEIPDHLVPADTGSGYTVRLKAMEPIGSGKSAGFTFEVEGERGEAKKFHFAVAMGDSLEATFEEAHRHLVNALRDLLRQAEALRQLYDRPPS